MRGTEAARTALRAQKAGVLAVACLAATLARAQELPFFGVRSLDAPNDPREIETADIDLDGDLDLLVRTLDPIGIDLYRAAGERYQRHAVPGWGLAAEIETADLNLDGLPDLVVRLGGFERRVRPALGDGAGGFLPLEPLSGRASLFVVVDLDGDGAPDICTIDAGGLATHRGRADGTFHPPDVTPLPVAVRAACAGDFDADGDPDLALLTARASVLIARNALGSIVEIAEHPLALEGAAHAVAAGDIDLDGADDLAVITPHELRLFACADGVPLATGAVARLSELYPDAPSDATMQQVELADITGDARPEAVLAARIPFVLHTTGRGTDVRFVEPRRLTGAAAVAVAAAPGSVVGRVFSAGPGVSRPGGDLFVTEHDVDPHGRARFVVAESIDIGSAYGHPEDIATGDVDLDGDADAVVLVGPDETLVVNDRAPGFRRDSSLEREGTHLRVYVVSLNPLEDDTPDLLLRPLADPRDPAPLDWNADGIIDRADTVSAYDCSDGDNDGRTSIAVNDGRAGFTTVFDRQIGSDARSIGADMDLDGDHDLVTVNACGAAITITPNPAIDGPLAHEWRSPFFGCSRCEAGDVAVGDIDGDGMPDAVLDLCWESRLVVLFNDGAGRPTDSRSLPTLWTHGPFCRITVADVTGDGLADVLTRATGGHLLFVSRPGRAFAPPLFVPSAFLSHTPAGPSVGEIADLNGDGLADLAVAAAHQIDGNTYESRFLAYFNRLAPACEADFDRDGRRDTRDLVAFLNAWAARRPDADCNRDGTLDAADVSCFLAVWQAGC